MKSAPSITNSKWNAHGNWKCCADCGWCDVQITKKKMILKEFAGFEAIKMHDLTKSESTNF